MFGWYLRWRHGRGFGVHSPFAFDFLRAELRPPRGYVYYHYDRLPQTPAYGRRTIRLIFRIMQRLRPASAAVSDSALRQTAQMACPGCRFTGKTPELAIISDDSAAAAVSADIASGATVPHLIILRPYSKEKLHLWQSARKAASGGMGFGGKHSRALVFVSNPKLPRQDFDIRF